MDLTSFKSNFEDYKTRYDILYKSSNVDIKESRLKILEEKTTEVNFFNSANSKDIFNEIKLIKEVLDNLSKLNSMITEIKTYIELLEENNDNDMYKELSKLVDSTSILCDKIEINTLLSDEYDYHNTIMTIHPGAGRYRVYGLG